MKDHAKTIGLLLAILALYGIAGRMDYADQIAQQEAAASVHHIRVITAQVQP